MLEVGDDSWVDIGCLILSDVSRGIHLTNYSQPTPVDSKFVAMIKEATPETYPKRWSGKKFISPKFPTYMVFQSNILTKILL